MIQEKIWKHVKLSSAAKIYHFTVQFKKLDACFQKSNL